MGGEAILEAMIRSCLTVTLCLWTVTFTGASHSPPPRLRWDRLGVGGVGGALLKAQQAGSGKPLSLESRPC